MAFDDDDFAAPDLLEMQFVERRLGVEPAHRVAQHDDLSRRASGPHVLQHHRAAILQPQDRRKHVAQSGQRPPARPQPLRLEPDLARHRDQLRRRQRLAAQHIGARHRLRHHVDAMPQRHRGKGFDHRRDGRMFRHGPHDSGILIHCGRIKALSRRAVRSQQF